jgi:hypothetical protein
MRRALLGFCQDGARRRWTYRRCGALRWRRYRRWPAWRVWPDRWRIGAAIQALF